MPPLDLATRDAEVPGCERSLSCGGNPARLRAEQPRPSQPDSPCPDFPAASHSRFNPSESSTYSTNGQTFSLQYGSGSLTGFFGYDTLTVSWHGKWRLRL